MPYDSCKFVVVVVCRVPGYVVVGLDSVVSKPFVVLCCCCVVVLLLCCGVVVLLCCCCVVVLLCCCVVVVVCTPYVVLCV
ncbi:hypothetical protein ADUPG1_003142, partial [Aduncisulcus paluster]